MIFVQDFRAVLIIVVGTTRVGEGCLADRELMQMTVGPAHRHLDDGVQPAEGRVARHLEPSPDRRFHGVQGDLQVVDVSTGDGRQTFNGENHASSLRRRPTPGKDGGESPRSAQRVHGTRGSIIWGVLPK